MRPAPPSPARALRARWTVATTAGEAAGFAVPAAGGAAAYAAAAGDPALVPAVVAAGAAEGAILGLGQSLVLCRKVAALRRRGWVVATAVAALFGWALAMPLGAFGGSLPAALLVLASTVVGAVLLAAVGAAQWLVLRRHVARAWRWTPANALAWLAGLTFSFVALALVDQDAPAWAVAGVGVASGLALGLVVAAVTGLALVRLLRPEARP